MCAAFTLRSAGADLAAWSSALPLDAYVRPLQRLQLPTPLAGLKVPAWQGYTAPKRFLKWPGAGTTARGTVTLM